MFNRMNIRAGVHEDFTETSELIESFVQEFISFYGFTFNFEKAWMMMSSCIEDSLVLEMDDRIVGVIAGMKMPNFLDNTNILAETIWYVLPNYRKYGLRLYFAFERMAREKGYHKLIMIHLGTKKAVTLEKFYIKHGFTLFEQQFIKEL